MPVAVNLPIYALDLFPHLFPHHNWACWKRQETLRRKSPLYFLAFKVFGERLELAKIKPVAVRVGFEPTLGFHLNTLSRRAT